jgi:UDP-GlcNAc:undecaprenyl-phosphate/decaprenyl-phosphate GlcNAc-1-phosphate transferase
MFLSMTHKIGMAVFLSAVFLAASAGAEEKQVLNSQQEKASYGIGVNMGRNFRLQGIEVDLDIMLKGLKDSLSGGKLLLSEDDLRTTLDTYQAEIVKKQAEIRKAIGEKNKEEGDAFLAENKKKEGVVTLPSGLQYKVLKEGDGKKPTDTDSVECNYRGTLVNGIEFDNSYRTGKAAALKVSAVMPGWVEALKLMPVGSKWLLFIPSQLAYGERGAGFQIGPNATLIFEVELLAIK